MVGDDIGKILVHGSNRFTSDGGDDRWSVVIVGVT